MTDKEINLEEVFAEIYSPINDEIKRGKHMFDYNDMMLFAKAVVKKLTINDVSQQRELLIDFLRKQEELKYIKIYENDFDFADKILKAINCG